MKSLFLLILFSLVLFPTPGKANEFFVAPDGGDSNPGTLKRPFATLERAQRAAQFQRRK